MSVVATNALSSLVVGLIIAGVAAWLNKKLNRIEVNGNSKLSDAFDRIDALSHQVEGLGGKPSDSAVPADSSGKTQAEMKDTIVAGTTNQANAVAIETVKEAVAELPPD